MSAIEETAAVLEDMHLNDFLEEGGSDTLSSAPTRDALEESLFGDGGGYGVIEMLPELPEDQTYTANGRPAFKLGVSKVLDLYFGVTPNLSKEDLVRLLEAAWGEERATTLRLIYQLGNCRRGEGGKADRVKFEQALEWLVGKDLETVLLNMEEVGRHGCLKSLVSLVQTVVQGEGAYSTGGRVEGAEMHKMHREEIRHNVAKKDRRRALDRRKLAIKHDFAKSRGVPLEEVYICGRAAWLASKGFGVPEGREKTEKHHYMDGKGEVQWVKGESANLGAWVSEEVKADFAEFIKAREARLREERLEGSRERLAGVKRKAVEAAEDVSGASARLEDGVADVFARLIGEEWASVSIDPSGRKLSGLGAKYAPSLGKSADKSTCLVDKICGRLGLTRKEYGQRVAKVRKTAKVPESLPFAEVDYQRMPAGCRRIFGEKVFRKHDKERYDAFLEKVKVAMEKDDGTGPRVHSGAEFPHQIIESACKGDAAGGLQWKDLVEKFGTARRADGDLSDLIPVCDVSGSMEAKGHGVTTSPMEVSVALSLLLASTAEGEWRGKMFNFSERSELVTVDLDKSLVDQVDQVKGFDWGGSTNLDAVFDQIVERAVESGMTPARVRGKRVVIFSDMEFDCAKVDQATPWETQYEAIVRKFRDAGFVDEFGETCVPLIVYWNLNAKVDHVPAKPNQKGVVLLSGFSAGLLEAFLEGRMEDYTPVSQMLDLLEKDCYQRLRLAA